MAIFAVLPYWSGSAPKLAEAVTRTYPGKFYKVSDQIWLVADAGGAKDVSDRLGVTSKEPEKIDSVLVIEAATYYGRSSPAVWSWIKENWEATASG